MKSLLLRATRLGGRVISLTFDSKDDSYHATLQFNNREVLARYQGFLSGYSFLVDRWNTVAIKFKGNN
jgi:hypothetical protein